MQIYLILVAIALIWSAGVGTTGYVKGRASGVEITTEKYESQIAKQKLEADKIIAFEAANVKATEKRLRDFKDNQEVQDASNQKKIHDLNSRVRSLSNVVGQLRDPYAGSGNSPQGATPTDASNSIYNRAEACGVLSKQLTGFLSDQAQSCDEINVAYISCRADAFSIRQ